MKHSCTSLIIILLAISTSCNSGKENQTDKLVTNQEIEKMANDFFTALGSADTTLLRNLVSNDFYMFEHDEHWTLDSLLKLMPRTIGRVWEINELDIEKNDELIHISYFNNSLKPVGRSWYESMLIKNTDKGLKIKFMHSTKLYLK